MGHPSDVLFLKSPVVLEGGTEVDGVEWEDNTRDPSFRGHWLRRVTLLEGFGRWDLLGISNLGNVWQWSCMKSFQEIEDDFELHHTQFYKYFPTCPAVLWE